MQSNMGYCRKKLISYSVVKWDGDMIKEFLAKGAYGNCEGPDQTALLCFNLWQIYRAQLFKTNDVVS